MTSVIALVSDLMFESRIREAARAGSLSVIAVRRPEQLTEGCRAEAPALVLVDLDDDRLRPIEAVRMLREDAALRSLEVVGFVSHVDGARAAAAQQAGCSRVLARGAFVAELPRLLAGGKPG